MRSSAILGINAAYHESAAAILLDGELVAAVEEERFTGQPKHGKSVRVHNAHHLPWNAISFCLTEAGLGWRDLDHVAYSLDPALRRKLACLGTDGPPDRFGHPEGERRFQESLRQVPALVAARSPARFHFVPHHLAHAWYAFATSPFDRAAVLIMDGIGEGASVSSGRGDRQHIGLDERHLFPHSVGMAWEKVARYIGLTEYDAGKVMALAGVRPSGATESSRLLSRLAYVRERLHVDPECFQLEHPEDWSGLEAVFGARPKGGPEQDTRPAACLQAATERLLVDVARRLQRRTGLPHLVYGGGVALNCRANQVLSAESGFEAIHVGPATHDAGTAPGAAWAVYAAESRQPVPHAPLGRVLRAGPVIRLPSASELQKHGWASVFSEHPAREAAKLLAQGALLGYGEGPCEFGPRALGGRSLLADPRLPGILARVNGLKGRHGFEPLACSVLASHAPNWLALPAAARGLARFMLTTARPGPAAGDALQSILHGDGTVRVQVVEEAGLPDFSSLLREFFALTGVPLLVNTSFNPRGEPMPATEERFLAHAEALGLSHLLLDGRLLRRCT